MDYIKTLIRMYGWAGAAIAVLIIVLGTMHVAFMISWIMFINK